MGVYIILPYLKKVTTFWAGVLRRLKSYKVTVDDINPALPITKESTMIPIV